MKPEDVWDVKKQATEPSDVMLDDAHLDAPTWHYLLAWLLLIFITNFTLIFLAYFFETFLGASEAIATFIYYAAFGPGILFASTAIGVSHLVQSTRAGANYGFGLLIFIIIANYLNTHSLNLHPDILILQEKASLKVTNCLEDGYCGLI